MAPGKYSEMLLGTGDHWEAAPAAVYRAGFEILEMLGNLLGLNERTAKFFHTYAQLLHPEELVRNFFEAGGVLLLQKLLASTVPLQDLWHFIVKFPGLFAKYREFNDKAALTGFVASLLRNISRSELSGELSEDSAEFVRRLQVMLGLVCTPEETNAAVLGFIEVFQLQGQLTPVSQPNTELFPELKTDIENKYRETLSSICKGIAEYRGGNCRDFKLKADEIYVLEHRDCDRQELSVLSSIEFMLTEQNWEESRKIIRWRKDVLTVALVYGWGIASDVAAHTMNTLQVTETDLLESNLRKLRREHLSGGDSEIGLF